MQAYCVLGTKILYWVHGNGTHYVSFSMNSRYSISFFRSSSFHRFTICSLNSSSSCVEHTCLIVLTSDHNWFGIVKISSTIFLVIGDQISFIALHQSHQYFSSVKLLLCYDMINIIWFHHSKNNWTVCYTAHVPYDRIESVSFSYFLISTWIWRNVKMTRITFDFRFTFCASNFRINRFNICRFIMVYYNIRMIFLFSFAWIKFDLLLWMICRFYKLPFECRILNREFIIFWSLCLHSSFEFRHVLGPQNVEMKRSMSIIFEILTGAASSRCQKKIFSNIFFIFFSGTQKSWHRYGKPFNIEIYLHSMDTQQTYHSIIIFLVVSFYLFIYSKVYFVFFFSLCLSAKITRSFSKRSHCTYYCCLVYVIFCFSSYFFH